MCDVCSREPLYYGGRGEECQPCFEAGDVGTTIGVAIGGIVLVLVAVGAVGFYFKRRGMNLTDKATGLVGESIRWDDGEGGQESGTGPPEKTTRLARLKELGGRLGVKVRILISLAQVVGEIGTTYNIKYPDFYSDMLTELGRINPNVKFLPFGCAFPNFDNYMFELVIQTAVPLGKCTARTQRAPTPHRVCKVFSSFTR